MNTVRSLLPLLATFFIADHVWAAVFDSMPDQIDPKQAYVIYSHGLIVEGKNQRPVHPTYGVYDFPGIRSALGRGDTFNLIAHHRPARTDVSDYVGKLVSWVKRLRAAGVPAHRITLLGFSRGGELTARAASALAPMPINTILMGTCWPYGVQDEADISLPGPMLSIHEKSDVAKTCEKLALRSVLGERFSEIEINTGLGHGAFYRPHREWVDPVLEWLGRCNGIWCEQVN